MNKVKKWVMTLFGVHYSYCKKCDKVTRTEYISYQEPERCKDCKKNRYSFDPGMYRP